MNRFLRQFVLVLAIIGVGCPVAAAQFAPYHGQVLPPAKRMQHVRILQGPQIERVEHDWAIIRWTSTNPGGADEHFAIAHFGTQPTLLNQMAKSHIRLNRQHTTTVFRVLLRGLKPGTTYYYSIGSMGGDGAIDQVKSPVLHFRTQ
jgi:phosphodiesterase/alkaline phosphatase D-like protein